MSFFYISMKNNEEIMQTGGESSLSVRTQNDSHLFNNI